MERSRTAMARQGADRTHQQNSIIPSPARTRTLACHPHDRLTPRQLEVLTLLYHGLRPRAIADELGLIIASVRTTLRDAYRQLGASGGIEALARARAWGLLSDRR
ncbi:MAG TPA: LuxR C-terminal-related transcriptional regulator [Ktedonobacterales bacterium]|nr:LuxR C-terminal-related transcriptional regulator [Ktedonobacterales bacterium]